MPIELEEDKLLKKEPDKEQLLALFTELEFRSFINKLLDNEQSVTSAKPTSKKQNIQQGVLFADEMTVVEDTPQITLDSVELVTDFASVATTAHTYKAVQTDTEIAELIALLSSQKEFCFDTETTSVEAIDAELVGLSFAVEPHTAYYVPISANPAEAKVVLAKFKPVFENEAIRKIGQNIKFDLMVLDNYGITVRGSLFDTMIAHYLINPELRHGMDYLAEILLNYRTIHIEELIGAKGKNQLNMRQVSLEKITEYAAEDADITLQLKIVLEPQLTENQLDKLFYDVEMPLVRVLAKMEKNGVLIDDFSLAQSSQVLTGEMHRIEREIQKTAGENINLSSPKQVGELLLTDLKWWRRLKKQKQVSMLPMKKRWKHCAANILLLDKFWIIAD